MEVENPEIRRVLLKAIGPALDFIGKIKIPMNRGIGYGTYSAMKHSLVPGMILLSHTRGHASNLVIPGEWKHTMMYAGTKGSEHYVIEAIGRGVTETPLVEAICGRDSILVLAPLFATVEQMSQAVTYARTLLGLPYDLLVEYDTDRRVNKAFYCSEVPWWSYNRVFMAEGKESPFTPRHTMGVATITPQDFADASDKWTRVGTWGKRLS